MMSPGKSYYGSLLATVAALGVAVLIERCWVMQVVQLGQHVWFIPWQRRRAARADLTSLRGLHHE